MNLAAIPPRQQLRRWLCLAAACALPLVSLGCGPPNQQQGPDPSLVADPPPGGPSSPVATTAFDRGVALVKQESWADAIGEFQKVLEAEPDNAQTHYYLGVCHERSGSRDAAAKAYEKALELDETQVDARVNLGALYLDDPPNPQKAIAVLEPAAKQDPGANDVRQNLAYAHRLLKQYDKAATNYREAIKIADTPQLRFAFGEMLVEAGKLKAAADQLKKALGGIEGDVGALAFAAHVFGKARRFDDCIGAFSKAIAAKRLPKLLLHRGLCKHGKGDEPGARKDYLDALRVDPKFQKAHYSLGMSYMADKKKEQAAAYFKKAVEAGPNTPVGKQAAKKHRELTR